MFFAFSPFSSKSRQETPQDDAKLAILRVMFAILAPSWLQVGHLSAILAPTWPILAPRWAPGGSQKGLILEAFGKTAPDSEKSPKELPKCIQKSTKMDPKTVKKSPKRASKKRPASFRTTTIRKATQLMNKIELGPGAAPCRRQLR